MDRLKDKMYNYEAMPPSGIWDAIAMELDNTKTPVIPIQKRNSKFLYYSLAAASVAVIIFCVIFFTGQTKNTSREGIVTSEKATNNTAANKDTGYAKNDHTIMTVPTEENDTPVKRDEEVIATNIPRTQKGGGPLETNDTDDSKKTDSVKTVPVSKGSNYLTIVGPEGQPVKVSAKMATLIDSSDNKVPPKPIWNKKINEWKEIMKGNTLAPTPGNFLDIVELTKALKDSKHP